jgi:hypothetical protein
MTAHHLDLSWLARFARAPADSTIQRAASVHHSVRALLGEADYDTILQGSYRTGTALHDLNDVDVLAISQRPDDAALSLGDDKTWQRFFRRLERRLAGSHHYAGKWSRGDKCIRLATNINIDIVPAVAAEAPGVDPIFVYSLGSKTLKKNWPRAHYASTKKKNDDTAGAFLPSVRLFKRWVRCAMPPGEQTPSYYVQCLLHSLPNDVFTGDLASAFVSISRLILKRHGIAGGYRLERLPRADGSGDLFTSAEWTRDQFLSFEKHLRQALPFAETAVSEALPERARNAWRMAFSGYGP